MTRTLWKNTLREIWNTKARFISILAIVALGVGLFSGIKATSPSMRATAAEFYKETNLMDIRLVSTVGFDDDDVEEILKVKDVDKIDVGYTADVIASSDNGSRVIRLLSMPKNGVDINNLVVIDGRLPEKKGEIVIEKNGTYSLGDTIRFQEKSGDVKTDDIVENMEYTVVGIVNSSMYVSFDRGTTTIGTGSVDYFAYIMPSDFSLERYTQIFVNTVYSKGDYEDESNEYKDGINSVVESFEKLGITQVEIFEEEYLEPAREDLENGINTYNEKKQEAEKALADAEKELKKGEKEYEQKIKDAQKELEEAQKELESGESLLPYSMTTYYEEILLAQNKINNGELQLSLGEIQLEAAKSEYATKIAQAESDLQTAKTQYDTAYAEFYNVTKPEAERQISASETLIGIALSTINSLENQISQLPDEYTESLKEKLSEAKELLEGYQEQLDNARQQLIEGEQKLLLAQEQLTAGEAELANQKIIGQEKLDEAQNQIDVARATLDEGKAEFESAKALGKQQLDDAQVKLSQGKLQLEDGKIQLEEGKIEGKKEITKGRETLEKEKANAEKELAKAKDKLNLAKKQLDALSDPEWIIQTREDLASYSGYYEDAQSIDNIATVFPLFFLLVALLVCLTTMTRLLEERRTEIGTLKALGYSSGSITFKYMLYAILAATLGGVIGSWLAVATLPQIIFDAYNNSMYNFMTFELKIPWAIITLGMLVSVLCISGVVLFVCNKSLHLKPAKLMRPKSPKPGKRILLERIPLIWNKLNFTSKVTARNIFRYKSRFLMTVLGVAGCTALIVMAFGLLDSLSALVDKQFGEIFKYNSVVIASDSADSAKVNELFEYVASHEKVDDAIKIGAENTEMISEEDKKYSVSLYVPETASSMNKMIDLHDRKTGNAVPLNNDGAVVSEKIARVMGAEVGDNITYTHNDKTYTVKIAGIFENYLGHSMFLSPNYYEEIYGREPQFNAIMESGEMTESEQQSFANEMLERDDVLTATFVTTMYDSFSNMMESMNIVVYVLILCAAALAFVVLYNLTNINIVERTREIATIKVLGFYNKEVASYIYRENIILTCMGILTGMVLGTFLTNFIIQTVEVDQVMFGREIFATTFIYAALFTMGFALIINFVMYFKMKKISMVDSLKSIE